VNNAQQFSLACHRSSKTDGLVGICLKSGPIEDI